MLDYLAAHEVAHLVEMNHSARFWRVVGKVCPQMERAKTWLDTHVKNAPAPKPDDPAKPAAAAGEKKT